MKGVLPRNLKRFLGCSLILVLAFLAGSSPAALSEAPRRSGLVHWVIDGDTFQLETGERVRLIGVDTPEYQPWKKKIQYYGQEASVYSKQMLNQKKVWLEADVKKKDKYGRSLAYVYLENGEFVNLRLVEEGYARAKYYKPNGRYRKIFKDAEKKAKASQKGMWKQSANYAP